MNQMRREKMREQRVYIKTILNAGVKNPDYGIM